jgi:hypothetical protein
MQKSLINRRVVRKALKQAIEVDYKPELNPYNTSDNQSSVISQVIYDIFGGEILKTHNKKGWHFYNRINGKRFDFTETESGTPSGSRHFEDILSTPDDTYKYFGEENYSTFFMKFIGAFEETIGL